MAATATVGDQALQGQRSKASRSCMAMREGIGGRRHLGESCNGVPSLHGTVLEGPQNLWISLWTKRHASDIVLRDSHVYQFAHFLGMVGLSPLPATECVRRRLNIDTLR